MTGEGLRIVRVLIATPWQTVVRSVPLGLLREATKHEAGYGRIWAYCRNSLLHLAYLDEIPNDFG